MEVIRIPQVSLVDGTGRRIGVYSEDPDWWQQLKAKQNTLPAIENDLNNQSLIPRQLTPVNNVGYESTSNIRARLIKENDSISEQKPVHISTIESTIQSINLDSSIRSNAEDPAKQCNVIGETPLHIAIMYDDFKTIKFLIETKGFDVNQRNVGGKFIGGFQSKLTNGLIQQSKYEGLAYYGEYPLAFAACFASKEIYDYLIEKGADPNLQDTNGNTVLHVLVINNKLDMFQYATNHPKKKALLTIKNNQDLTPVNLAAKLGRKDIFEKLLELRNIEFWRYSNITCSAYQLDGLDTVDPDGKIAWNAALSYIVNGETEDHLDMLEIGVVKRLLGDKWSTYAQRLFFKKLFISSVHLIFLSIAVYTRASATGDTLAEWPPKEAVTWIRYISEIAVLIGCLAILFLQAQEIYAQGFIYYLKNLAGEPANVFYVIFCILILIALPFRFATFKNYDGTITNKNVEDTFVILAIPCGWFHLLFYARVINLTGPFVVMIYKMIIGDILTFSSIYILLLFGFSLGFYYLYKNIPSDYKAMNNLPESILLSFQMTLGEFKARLTEFDKLYYSDFTKVVFVSFMILMHILLLNMLIAMMGNTYHQIIKKSEKEWRRQWSQVIILLERSFSPKELQKFQKKYSIKIPSKDPNNENAVGLMVIKKVAKTKAFQKTTCIRNWKRFFKTVLGLLRENNYTSSQLLDMWANKDFRVVKTKKVKKDFDWNTYGKTKKSSSLRNLNTNNTVITEINDSSTDRKPPLPEPVKLKFPMESSKSLESNKNSLKKKDVDESLLKKRKDLFKADETTPDESSNSSYLSSSEKTSDLNSQPHVSSRYLQKKTFYPNQTSKIYPGISNSFSTLNNTSVDYQNEYQFNFSKQVSISPVRENTKFDLGDIKRPFSSSVKKNGEAYIKKDKLPKFAQKQPNLIFFSSDSKSPDENMSIDSDNSMSIFKRNNSHDEEGGNRENESKI
ncbi:unnamed protein product [Brachionus calyciflorus]|uniref:Ion transport domain-containing protein n=1 Tax=Brachionus calyciflorus TaxID=104777 RepID=A0A813Z1U0_9BILA|nr:unnamed protein product [Brachionus calyciflorus]